MEQLASISPLDGRYRDSLESLSGSFSEGALIRSRVKVEVLYLLALSEAGVIRDIESDERNHLLSLFEDFEISDAERVKEIEGEIRHDVKAVEYFVKESIKGTSLEDVREFVHFALTSEDVTNLAYSLMIKDFLEEMYSPEIDELVKSISELSVRYKDVAMLSRTHGQPASPTTLGKEFAVFVHRLKRQLDTFPPRLTGKLNGAVGNYNAHQIAYPGVDWIEFSTRFIKGLGLEPNLLTTQIEDHDRWAELFHAMMRVNTILIDFTRDMWTYISLDYLKQRVVKGEVGSSTMPHKVNPIDFENSEGNLGVANALLAHFADKLPISRLQRDLSDSTVSRNIGVAFGHIVLGIKGCIKGLDRIDVDEEVIAADLDRHPEILSEAIQSVLRRAGVEMPYEKLKKLTRGRRVSLEDLSKFIKELDVSEEVQAVLSKLKPEDYTGLAPELTDIAVNLNSQKNESTEDGQSEGVW